MRLMSKGIKTMQFACMTELKAYFHVFSSSISFFFRLFKTHLSVCNLIILVLRPPALLFWFPLDALTNDQSTVQLCQLL